MPIINTATGADFVSWDARVFIAKLFTNPALSRFFTSVPNVRGKVQLSQLSALGKITKKWDTCGAVDTGDGADYSERTLQLTRLMSQLDHCVDKWDGLVVETLMRAGTNFGDLTGTQVEALIAEAVMSGVANDQSRILWFGDTDLADTDYNQLDGFWKLISDGVNGSSSGIRRYTITENIDTDPCDAYEIIRGLIRAASNQLRAVPKPRVLIPVTGNLFDALTQCKQDNCCIETTFSLLENGFGDVVPFETTQFDGYTVVAMRDWDTWIADLGETDDVRAAMIYNANWKIGTDLADISSMDLRFWYDITENKNYTRVAYQMGLQYHDDQYIAVAY
jgi:hypothetical protein